MLRHQQGREGEDTARQYLEQQGLTFVEANFKCDMGEIDLVMQDQDCLVFVEVKFRTLEHFASILEQIRPAQCQRIRQVAQLYVIQRRLNEHTTPMRFDVVAVVGALEALYWLEDAF
jgi:putative endonuclease